MSDLSPSPAPLPDDDLRETLDLLATAVASISDRVDDQTQVLDRVNKSATEARQAAFAAQRQTSPELYGELVGEIMEGRITEDLNRISKTSSDLLRLIDIAMKAIHRNGENMSDDRRDLLNRERKLARFKARLPWVGLGAVVLALALTVTLPRFLASNASTCAVLGASWNTTTTGVDACVFFRP